MNLLPVRCPSCRRLQFKAWLTSGVAVEIKCHSCHSLLTVEHHKIRVDRPAGQSWIVANGGFVMVTG